VVLAQHPAAPGRRLRGDKVIGGRVLSDQGVALAPLADVEIDPATADMKPNPTAARQKVRIVRGDYDKDRSSVCRLTGEAKIASDIVVATARRVDSRGDVAFADAVETHLVLGVPADPHAWGCLRTARRRPFR